MTPASSFLDVLKVAADQAAVAEDAFGREVAQRAKTLEQERAFAHRRLNFMRSIAEAVASAESREVAVVAAKATIRNRLGWSDDSEARIEVFERFAPVAQAVFDGLAPPEAEAPAAEVLRALDEFETWYRGSRQTQFWILFEHYIPETPRVDF